MDVYVLLQNELEWLHGLCFGEEAGARNLVFFRVKWLQRAMKGTSCVRRVRLGSFQRVIGSPLVFATCGCKSHCNGCMNVACTLFWGRSPSTKPCVFPCIKWLQLAMKGTSCVRRVRLGSFQCSHVLGQQRNSFEKLTRTHGPGWRTARASSIDEKNFIV